MDWEQQYNQWQSAQQARDYPHCQGLEAQTRTALSNRKLADVTWHIQVLEGTTPADQERRWFLTTVLRKSSQMPNRLFSPMLRAGVYERNPSYNRNYIEPCLRCFGTRAVNKELIESYTLQGSDFEKAGVASAFYWSFGLNGYHDIKVEDVSDYREQVRQWFLTEFVHNENLDVRRRIIPGLDLNPNHYPTTLHDLIPKVITIARNHTDEYIRHRIEMQLGNGGPYLPLPK